MQEYYKRNLPHFQPIGGAFFVTFRLHGSIPREIVEQFKRSYEDKMCKLEKTESGYSNLRREYFKAYESVIHSYKIGPHHLTQRDVANIVKDELHGQDGDSYKLIAYSIMSNHVHMVIDTSVQLSEKVDEFEKSKEDYIPLSRIMKNLKGRTGFKCNKALNQNGKFWARESFDIFIKNEKMLHNVIGYTLNNPVKAGLVSEYGDHEFTYLAEDDMRY